MEDNTRDLNDTIVTIADCENLGWLTEDTSHQEGENNYGYSND